MPVPAVPPKPCPKCNGHLDTHGSAVNVYDYRPVPGVPVLELKSINEHENHKHGSRTCDECNGEFHGHYSFSSDHPDSPANPFHANGKTVLVHKRCLLLHQSKLEAESRAVEE